jgi:site-specific DNA recombinase
MVRGMSNRKPLKYAPNYLPQRAVLYCRISDARAGTSREVTTKGVDNQEANLRAHFEKVLGWGILAVLIENDTSAFKRRKVTLPDGSTGMRVVRPDFRKALGWLADGTADGFGAVDLDRAMRDPRDLEDMIDLVEETHVPVKSITGSLQLDNDAGITMARVMVAMANKSSRDTSRRIRDDKRALAAAGKHTGGRRRFGFEDDGVTVRPSEADWVEQGSKWTLQDPAISLRRQVADLKKAGVETVTGAPWTTSVWRQILMRPRNAGLLMYGGEILGKAPWDPIVPRDMWEAVCARLNAEERRTSPGPMRQWLGSGIYLCGKCRAIMRISTAGTAVRVNGTRKRSPIYRCSVTAHVSRDAAKLDTYVEDVLIVRLSQPDAADLVRPPDAQIDTAQLRSRAAAIRDNMASLARDRALGLISRDEQLAARAAADQVLAEIDEQLSTAFVDSPAQPLIDADDVEAAWEAMPMGVKRSVLRSLVTVTVNSVARGRRKGGIYFDESAVDIQWVPSAKQRWGVPGDPQ